MRMRRIGAAAAALLAVSAGAAQAHRGGTVTGPSSSQSPYVVPVAPGVTTESLITVGDSVNEKWDGTTPYRYVGIPDGQGAFDNGDGTFTLLSHHEIAAANGTVRDHGAKGAFVSRWTIDKRTFEVLDGEDLIKEIATWNGTAWNAPAKGVALGRLCSADLALKTAWFNYRTNKGYARRLFMSGEEVGIEGRAFAHTLGGRSFEVPAVGKMGFENVVGNPGTGDRTVTIGLDDGTGGQVYAYAGDKRKRGNVVQRAGLDGGNLYGIKVDGFPEEPPATGIPSGTRFTGFNHGDVRAKSGAALEAESNAAGVTRFLRPEDGAWDPSNPRLFYFATTASFTGNSRLWRLTFDDPANPAAGGVIDMLLDGTEGQKMMDNLTVDANGRRLIIQEDPGNQAHIAAIWSYEVASDTLTKVAQHDPNRFVVGGSAFITQDEESSGIIDMSAILGRGWYLGDTQAHRSNPDPELVEYGQMWALNVPTGSHGDEDDGDDGDGHHGGRGGRS
jgi:hypothetical protein